jgi:hypothetical protein
VGAGIGVGIGVGNGEGSGAANGSQSGSTFLGLKKISDFFLLFGLRVDLSGDNPTCTSPRDGRTHEHTAE